MPYKPTGRPRGRPPKNRAEVEDFGLTAPAQEAADPEPEQPEETPPEILALGLPPEDLTQIPMWHYRMCSTMAALAMRDTKIPLDARMRRFIQASAAAAKHLPDATRAELVAKIEADAAAVAGKKKAKAAARLETVPEAGSAKIIPIRPNEPK